MRTVVIAGGTRGIGKALADSLTGWNVVALGSADGDLSSVKATKELIERLPERIDALVLSAGRFDRRRLVTADGLEQTFAIGVLAKYLLVEGLRPALERADTPIVLNLCGVGGIKAGRIHWDDLQLTSGYSLFTATMQGARANDLLGAGFADQHPGSSIRYVLYNPLFVDSGMHRYFGQPHRAIIGAAARLFGATPAAAAVPLKGLLERPPAATLTALRRDKPVSLTVDPADAARLYRILADFT